MKNETKDVILAILCTILVVFTLEHFFPKNSSLVEEKVFPTTNQMSSSEENLSVSAPEKSQIRPSFANDLPVIEIKSETLRGQIRLQGATFDKMSLIQYKDSIAKDSPDVVLLNQDYFMMPFFKLDEGFEVPDEKTIWHSENKILTPDSPVEMTWTNSQGIVFTRQVSLDDKYMFTITDSVKADTQALHVSFASDLYRINPSVAVGNVHQGLVGILDNKLQEEKYTAIEKKGQFVYSHQNSWAGFGDKYWLVSFVYNGITDNQTTVSYRQDGADNLVELSYQTPKIDVKPQEKAQNVVHFFVGPKDLDLLDAYQDVLNIDRFDLAIDFGWYYFLTKPFLRFLSWIYSLVGNMGVAILIFATLLRLLMFPIAGKSFESMAKMRKVQPKIKELQQRYKNDPLHLNEAMMTLYKKENINPASGCLPLFIQIPVFFSLYKVLSVSIEMRQAPFFGWIHDLSVKDPSSVFTLFGLVEWPIPNVLNIGVWPVLMGITMFLQQRLNPTAETPSGDKQAGANMTTAMRWMPLIFTFMLGGLASGLVIYWTWSNILSIIQQRYIMKKYKQ